MGSSGAPTCSKLSRRVQLQSCLVRSCSGESSATRTQERSECSVHCTTSWCMSCGWRVVAVCWRLIGRGFAQRTHETSGIDVG